MLKYFWTILFAIFFYQASGAVEVQIEDLKKSLVKVEAKKDSLLNQTKYLEDKINKDTAAIYEMQNKPNPSKSEIAALNESISTSRSILEKTAKEARSQMDIADSLRQQLEIQTNLKPSDLALGQVRLHSSHLLLSLDNVKNLLKVQDLKLSTLTQQMDNTLLGMYIKDSTEKAIDNFGKNQLCDILAKNQCSSSKKNSAAMRYLKSEFESFGQWKSSQR